MIHGMIHAPRWRRQAAAWITDEDMPSSIKQKVISVNQVGETKQP